MSAPLAPPTIDPLAPPVADEYEEYTEVDELPRLAPNSGVESVPASPRALPPPRRSRLERAGRDAEPGSTTPVTAMPVEPVAVEAAVAVLPGDAARALVVPAEPAEEESTVEVPATPDARRGSSPAELAAAEIHGMQSSAVSSEPVSEHVASEHGQFAPTAPEAMASMPAAPARATTPAAPVATAPGVPAPTPAVSTAPLVAAPSVVAPVARKVARLPVPDPSKAVDDGHFSEESLPTRFDVGAGDRRGSPTTTAEQRAAQQESARTLLLSLEEQLKGKQDKLRAGRLHYECARLYESPLGDLPAAAKHYEAAVKQCPEHVPSVRGARRVELQLKRYPAALASLETEIALCADPRQKALLWYEKGCILAGRLAKKGEAREAFEQAAELSPMDASILKAAAHAQEQALAWEPLCRTLERLANALAPFPTQRAATLAQMARVVSVRLKDPARAIELYKAAVLVDPRAPGALRSLAELLYRGHRWAELVTVLEKEATLLSDRSARALTKYRIARLQLDRLGNLDAAVLALEEATNLTPEDPTILAELMRAYEAARRHAELAAALERWATLENPPRAETFLRLGQLYDEHLEAKDRAIERYSKALAVAPGYLPARLSLERLRTARGEWQELVAMLAEQAEHGTDADERSALHGRIAVLCEERLGAIDHAVQHHRRALECQPSCAPSYKALVRLYSQAGRWHELVEVYERRLEQDIGRAERIATLFKIGRLEEDALGTPQVAVATYQRILDIDPKHLEAIESLQRAAERGGRIPDLVDALEREANIAEDRTVQRNLWYRAAELLCDQLGETERAIERLHALLEKEAKYLPAIQLLARLYHRDRRWSSLIDVYHRQLAVLSEPRERAALLFQMGELAERELGDREQAIGYYRKASQSDPTHTQASQALNRALVEAGQWKEVVALVEQEAKQSADASTAARLWFSAGELWEMRLDSLDRALDSYTKAIDVRSDYRPAIDAATRLLEQRNNFQELKEQLHAEAELAQDPLLSLEAAYREGEVLRDNLKQLVPAAEAFERVLGRQAEHAGALLALERIYAQLEDKKNLARLYEAEASSFEGAPARVAAYRAWIQLLLLEDGGTGEKADRSKAEAIRQAHLAVLQLVPNDTHTLLELEPTALELRDDALVQQIDAKLAAAELDRHSVAAYQTRLAEAFEARGDATALELFRVALGHDPENLGAASGISRIAERSQSPELLAEAAENEASLLQRPTLGARMLVLAAHKLAARGDRSHAATALVRALELDPHHVDAADALISVLSGQGQDAYVVDALSHAAAMAKQPHVKAALWSRAARLQHSTLADNGAAIASAQRAVREEPTNPELHKQLADYHLAGQNWKEAVHELQELLKQRPEPQLELRALVDLATTLADRLGKPQAAEAHAKAALGIEPNHRVALGLLLRVQLGQSSEAAAATASRLVQVSKDPAERADALTHLGRLEAQRGREKQAAEAFVEAVSILGPASSAGAQYRDWLVSLGKSANWQLYVDALARFLASGPSDPRAQKAAHAELARTLADRLGQTDAGLEELARALALDPRDAELRVDLARRSFKAGQLEAAARQYHDLVRMEPSEAAHFRALSSCYERLMRVEEARWVLGALVWSGTATPDEARRYRESPPRPAAVAARALDASNLSVIERDAPVAGPALELLAAMAPALPKLYPPSFESYGVAKADRVGSRTNNSLRHIADRVALVFGVEAFELYVHQGKAPLVALELSDEPALFVNANVSALNEAEQVFVFARAFANVARGLHFVDRLGPVELRALFTAAARTQSPSFGEGKGDARTLDAIGRRITRAMPWFSGGRLETAARSYAAANLSFSRWVHNVVVSAAAAALLVSDDLAGGLRLMQNTGTPTETLLRVQSFAVSESALELRRRLFGS